MKMRSVCFAYLLCLVAPVAQGSERRAVEMAECGYLSAMAVEQMSALPEKPEVFEEVVGNVIDFTNLYYVLSGQELPNNTGQITPEMFQNMTRTGARFHERRIGSMSPKASLKLSNNLLSECRTDLYLLGPKLLHG